MAAGRLLDHVYGEASQEIDAKPVDRAKAAFPCFHPQSSGVPVPVPWDLRPRNVRKYINTIPAPGVKDALQCIAAELTKKAASMCLFVVLEI
jgi:hypothetical protein